jgi:transcriptional repressor NrdR
MRCPYCGAEDTRVVDSRPAESGTTIRRRRECPDCDNRFTTYERREAVVVVRKRAGTVEPFDRAKLLRGMKAAVADRDVPDGALEELAAEIEEYAREYGPEVPSEAIGRLALEGLRSLDEVSYLRFASVHKQFEGAGDFHKEMAALEEER